MSSLNESLSSGKWSIASIKMPGAGCDTAQRYLHLTPALVTTELSNFDIEIDRYLKFWAIEPISNDGQF